VIIARMGKTDPGESLLFLLEPGNIAKLQLGQPIVKKLHGLMPQFSEDAEIVIALCPDVAYLVARVKAGDDFMTALEKAMKRPDIYVRPQDAEEVVKFEAAQ
jgi:hypothetical protein